jgi:predicted DNA-binding antitoxin AbrB/MazE fold protein
MNETIAAIYENGVLRPLAPLALPEHTEVQISIKTLPPASGAEAHRRQVIVALVAAGLAAPASNAPTATPLSEDERNDLAHRLPVGRPLSEIIIEEREGC